jgi:hypothetical protein
MSASVKLTEQQKQNGKRKLLIPSKDIQEIMEPITEDEFAALVDKASLPSPQPDSEMH